MCKIENGEFKDGEWSVREVSYHHMTTYQIYKYCLETYYYRRGSYIITFEKDHIFFDGRKGDGFTAQRIYYDNEFIFWSAIKNV